MCTTTLLLRLVDNSRCTHITCSGSQEERISILKMALAEKGIVGRAHYDVQPTARATTANSTASAVPAAAPPTANGDIHEEEEEEGVYL